MNQRSELYKKGDRIVTQVFVATLAVILLRVILDFVYIIYVDRYFSRSLSVGVFQLQEISVLRILESYLLTFILAVWLFYFLYRRCRPSGIALILYFIIVILPLFSLYGMTNAPAAFAYAAAGSFAILLVVTGTLPTMKVPRPGYTILSLGIAMFVGIIIYVYGMLLLSGGLGRLSFDLLSVYDVRAEYVSKIGPLMRYLVPWQANVINIFVLCYALHRKRLSLFIFAGVAQLLLFGMTGFKSFLLAPFLSCCVFFIWRKRNAFLYFVGGAILVILTSYIFFIMTQNHLTPSILIRRLFFVPAANHFIYYDFFSQPENVFVMLSHSIFKHFITYPYDMPITRVISWTYWGRDFGPNVGYLGDAFANFGFMGMFLFSMILGVFLRIVDSISRHLPANLIAAIIAVPAMALANSALFTSLLTHGFILSLIMIWLLQKVEERHARSKKMSQAYIPITNDCQQKRW